MIDFAALPLSPNQSRAARNYLGLSQAQTAEQSGLQNHKLKRFETGNYLPDAQFLQDLRDFFKGQDYNFHDADAPGANARANGDVFPAGLVGNTGSVPEDTDGSGYVAKYVSKNIDGHGIDVDEETGLSGASSAARATAWARLWGIHQFQFFGVPAITPLGNFTDSTAWATKALRLPPCTKP